MDRGIALPEFPIEREARDSSERGWIMGMDDTEYRSEVPRESMRLTLRIVAIRMGNRDCVPI